jgi:hypothetical protein
MGARALFEDAVSVSSRNASRSSPRGLERELNEQVEIFADEPSQSVMYSDLYDRIRSGVRNVRRLLPTRTAHAAR